MVFTCPVCDRKFASFESYMEHQMLGLCAPSAGVLRCPKCGRRFRSLKKAYFHMFFCGVQVLEELGPNGVFIRTRDEIRKALYAGSMDKLP